MAAIPWTTLSNAPPDSEVVVMASRLPLARYRDIPSFLVHVTGIRRQLAKADGLYGYALDADLAKRTFWTVSAWRDREALGRFNRGDPHRRSVQTIRRRMAPTTFVFWSGHGSDLPIRWAEVRERITERSRAGGGPARGPSVEAGPGGGPPTGTDPPGAA